jgi:hypothetical protein
MPEKGRVDADLLGQSRCLPANERSAEAACLRTAAAKLEVSLLD